MTLPFRGCIIYTEQKRRAERQEEKKMVKVTGLEVLSEIVERNERIEKAESEIRKHRIKDLIAQGIDKAVAEVMVDTFTSYEVVGY